MRIQTTFGERKITREHDEPKRTFFLAFEGDTENQYFCGICNNRELYNIDELIEIIPLTRTYDKTGWGHPKKILECLTDYLAELSSGQYDFNSIAKEVVTYLKDEGISQQTVDKDSLCTQLAEYCTEHFQLALTVCEESTTKLSEIIIDFLVQEGILEDKDINDINAFLNKKVTYDKNFDKVCVIVDRDKESFTHSQYDPVCELYKAHGFELYITNPCFDFWLILHFGNEHNTLDSQKLLENKKDNGQTYTEIELKKLLPSYSKASLDFKVIQDNVRTALKNAEDYADNLTDIKTQAGTNIPHLLELLGVK